MIFSGEGPEKFDGELIVHGRRACGADTRQAMDDLRPPQGPGRGVQGHPAGQQVYRRELPPGPWPRIWRPTAPAWPTCSTTCWRPPGSAAFCSPPSCPRAATSSSPRSAPVRTAAPGTVCRQCGAALAETAAVTKGENLFPRIDMEKALEELEQAARPRPGRPPCPAVEVEPQLTEKVDFDTFCKIRLPGGEGEGL